MNKELKLYSNEEIVQEVKARMKVIDELPSLQKRVDDAEDKKEEFEITCSKCGNESTVPFKPNPKWSSPLCRDCYAKENQK